MYDGNHFAYKSDEELRDRGIRNARQQKLVEKINKEFHRICEEKAIKVSINGKVYNSIRHASDCLNVSEVVLHKKFKELMESSRSEIDFEIKTIQTFSFKKIKSEQQN